MKQAFILLMATVVVFVAPGVQGTDHLSFSNMTANVTRSGCGTDKLCVETPDDCEPTVNNSCLFTSVNGTPGVAPNGTTLRFQISGGNSTGDFFFAVAITANASEGNSTVFICGRNQTTNSTIGVNGTFFFRTMLRNNTDGTLTPTERNVTGIQNLTTSNRIQCEFVVPGLNASARRTDTTFVVLLGNGTVNGSNLGTFNVSLTTAALNLTDPTSNNNNATNNTTSSVNITRTGCGTSKLCVETPDDCDPSTNNTCLFTSVDGTAGVAPNGTTLSFELSLANRTGDIYVAVALTANASEGTSTLYVCGRNGTSNMTSGTFFFQTAQRNNVNGSLTVMNTTATGIQNSTTNVRIQCVFNISGVNATAKSRAGNATTTFVVLLGSGSVNGSTLGNFTANVTTAALNVIDPASNVNTTNNATSTSTVNITRTGCGTSKLCVEAPDDCDPATNDSCLFISVIGTTGTASNDTTLSFELSGANSTGDRYIGVALTTSADTATLYVCGRNGTTNGVNGTFFFLTVQINNTNGALTVMNTTATGIQNSTSDIKIQCLFNITLLRSRNAATSFGIQLGSGSVNGSTLGNFTANVTTPVLNLLDPTSNVNTTNTSTSSLNITRTGCGSSKLCVETPDECDPSTNNSCLFTSVNGTAGTAPNGAMLSFELSGANNTGDRYIGVALSANASEGTATLYVCGRNGTNGTSGTFFFLTVQRNNTNGALTVMNTTATGIQNSTTDVRIQCLFSISGVNATATARPRNASTTFVVQLGSGTVNGSTLGNFTANVTTVAVNLLDPTSNTTGTTTSGANSAVFPQVVSLLLSLFILTILKAA